ncbi:MAG: hypothetical protein GYA48_07900 [Chloroflexi bacterium]|nr:hypothetical protein [Chloroflexota bacterium]
MSAYDEVSQRALQLLGDPLGGQYPAAVLAEAARRALEAFSRCAPRIESVEWVVESASGRQALPLAGAWLVLDVEWRAASGILRAGRPWQIVWQGGQPVIEWLSEPYPQPGDGLLARCALNHSLEGLDGAPQSSVKDADLGLLAQGAAGYAAQMRAAQLTESYGSRASDLGQLAAWGEAQLQRFEQRLAEEARRGGVEIPWALPQRGWPCDRWEVCR